MTSPLNITGWRGFFVWGMLLLYASARVCQLYSDQLPTLLIVILHVVPPALFALVHGSLLYGRRGISVFAVFCLGFGTLAESVSLRTGFPFGHYYFTDVMGPKIFQLPLLLALAYVGIGYVAWVLALVIPGYANKPIKGMRVVTLPFLASLIMVVWDLSMDPNWSTLDRAWIWQDGGIYFGVPPGNFFGWFLTAYLYYQAFALYCRANPIPARRSPRRFWLPAILFYAVCGLGNVLILKSPMAPPVVTDASGRRWLTSDILGNCVLLSLLTMTPIALLAWLKTQERRPGRLDASVQPVRLPDRFAPASDTPCISVIIPAFNEERCLPATLQAIETSALFLRSRDGINTEVIVVDNNSADGTAKVARSLGARVVAESEHNIARVRNHGAANAQGRVLVFVDADTHIPAGLLQRIYQVSAAPGSLGGAVDTDYQPKKRNIRIYLGLWKMLGRAFGMAQGATQFCLRDTFTELGGYDESLFMSEDADFYARMRRHARYAGGSVSFIDELKVIPSSRRFDLWTLWRTLIWTNPLVIALLRRVHFAWRGWYDTPPR